MADARFLVGIDLGTSNCVMAYAELAAGASWIIQDFPIQQLVQLGEVSPRPLLPSCLYFPSAHERPSGRLDLPWNNGEEFLVGEFARRRGAQVPGRLVASAKSWLCHPGVDRTAPILPWGGASDVKKISPVEASAKILRHLASAWDGRMPPLREQEVVITVPASFDEVARALTVSAAHQAGFEKFTLLEEPQAAFYDFISKHRESLATVLSGIRLVLVVDVGGGTTDFTLVQTEVRGENPVLRRLAVGNHLLLGGDNMDAALARRLEESMTASNRKLGAAQWTQLVHSAREAKEALLGLRGLRQFRIAIAAEGSQLLGKSWSGVLTHQDAERVVLDGFFPTCVAGEEPRRVVRTGIQELGLPYAPDAAITRHLSSFLLRHANAGFAVLGEEDAKQPAANPLPRPDAILFNGGVFNSPRITERLRAVLSRWWPEREEIPVLPHESLELAVARGAVAYGLARHGQGIRIGGGTARSFYVGVGEREGAFEGTQALCVIPRGLEEGETVELSGQSFELVLGNPVQFPLYSSTSDRFDRAGEVVSLREDLHRLPPIHTVLKGKAGRAGAVPVHLRATLTELGTLELWCVAKDPTERWRLEFEIRGSRQAGAGTSVASMPPRFEEARAAVEQIYPSKSFKLSRPEPRGVLAEPKQLWSALTKSLGPREQWNLAVLREIWAPLLAGAAKRRRSADHERVFYQLAGFSLRPGFGYPLDEWRCEETFRLFSEGVQFHKEKPVWIEFWVMWRRISGGLDSARQAVLWDYLKPHLASKLGKGSRIKGIQPEGLDEIVRASAALENIASTQKAELGNWLVEWLESGGSAGGPWAWALGRLGARTLIYGSAHQTVDPQRAEAWLKFLVRLGVERVNGAAFAVVQLARLTGDRMRDVSDETRQTALTALRKANSPEHWLKMLTEVTSFDAADEARALGDTLPVGLKLALTS